MKKMGIVLIITALLLPALAACAGDNQQPAYSNPYEEQKAWQEKVDKEQLKEGAFVIGLSFAATLEGVRAAALGSPGTFVMANGDYMAFFWQAGEYPAFVVMDVFAQKPIHNFAMNMGGSGQKVDLRSVSDIINYMRDTGWIDVPKGQVPKFLLGALESQSNWVATMGMESLPTFIVLPTWADTGDVLELYYPEIDS